MNYSINKVEGQQLMFNVITEHHGKEVSFYIVCASDESEIPDLVIQYLDILDNPPDIQINQTASVDINTLLQEQQAMITELKARIEQLEAK